MDLTEKQKRFCEEYIACKFNASQAAINAGYSQKTAGAIGHENLKKPEIQNYLSELIKKDGEAVGITKERVLQEMARLAFVDHRKFFNEDGNLKQVTDLDDETAAALAGFEVTEEKTGFEVTGQTKKIKTYDKTKSLELLGRHLGMFEKDNEQQNKTVTVNIV